LGNIILIEIISEERDIST